MRRKTVTTNNTSPKKLFHRSLAVQVNVLIILITLVISLLMVAISANNYYKAIMEPRKQRLSYLEFNKEVFTPYLEYFYQFFGTEELLDARASMDSDSDSFLDWMENTPSFTSDDPVDDRTSLFLDTISFDVAVAEFVEPIALDIACFEIDKQGTTYRVSYNDKKQGWFSESYEFGHETRFTNLEAQKFLYPSMEKVDSSYLVLRCVPFTIENSEGRLWLAYDLTELVQDYFSFLARSVLYVFILTAAASIVSVILLRHYVTIPISALALSAKKFKPGEDGTYSVENISTVEIRAENELGDLSREIRSMQSSIVENTERLRNMTAAQERISTELNLSARIQKSMLPSIFPPFPERKEFDLFASMTPARDVGGDFYDFFLIDDDHLALVMADVSGKGVPGALFMMITKVILKNNAMISKSAGETLAMTNDLICANNRMEMFVTVWMGILEISTGKITAANAGHEYPAIMRNGCFRLYKDRHSFVIGGMERARYKEYELQLEKGDKLFVYTDGVPEATNAGEELFGTERMIDALNRYAGLSPKEILDGVKSAVDGFVGEAEQFDDLTMLCLEYNG